MCYHRRTTSFRLFSQALCFCLLLQGSGIAQALPLPPKQTFVTKSEIESAHVRSPEPDAGKSTAEGSLKRFVGEAWNVV